VDDEEPVRDLGYRILARAGYSVLCAVNAHNALAIYHERKASNRVFALMNRLNQSFSDQRQINRFTLQLQRPETIDPRWTVVRLGEDGRTGLKEGQRLLNGDRLQTAAPDDAMLEPEIPAEDSET